MEVTWNQTCQVQGGGMNGLNFQNFPKFLAQIGENLKKSGNFGPNLAKNRADWYMNGSLFLWNLVNVWVHFQIPSGTSLPKKPNNNHLESSPSPPCLVSRCGNSSMLLFCFAFLEGKISQKSFKIWQFLERKNTIFWLPNSIDVGGMLFLYAFSNIFFFFFFFVNLQKCKIWVSWACKVKLFLYLSSWLMDFNHI